MRKPLFFRIFLICIRYSDNIFYLIVDKINPTLGISIVDFLALYSTFFETIQWCLDKEMREAFLYRDEKPNLFIFIVENFGGTKAWLETEFGEKIFKKYIPHWLKYEIEQIYEKEERRSKEMWKKIRESSWWKKQMEELRREGVRR